MRNFTLNVWMGIFFLLFSATAFGQFKMHEPAQSQVCYSADYQATPLRSVTSIFTEDFSGGTFPPAGWSIAGSGQTNWSAAATNNAGGEAPEARLNWSPQFVGNSKLVSAAIATSGYSALVLEFKHNVDDYGGGYMLKVETTSDGTTWNEVWSVPVSGSMGPEQMTLLIDNDDVGSDNFKVAFTFDGDSYQLNYWYIDDVMISEALDYDATAVSMQMPWLLATGTSVAPGATVANIGTTTASFDVSFKIMDGGTAIYSHTIAVAQLEPFTTEMITFPEWVAVTGSFQAEIMTMLSGDQNPVNDTMSMHVDVMEGLVAKKPLYEEFTSSTCGPCVSANIAIAAVLDANPDEYTLIKYQMNWPGSGDPYYTAEGGVRKTYYGCSFVPDLYINSFQLNPAGSLTQTIFDQYATALTAIDIDITTATIDDENVISIETTINPLLNFAAGLKAHIVVIEKLTVGNAGGNGETEWHNVMMKMLPDAAGTTLDALASGVPVTLSQTFDMDETNMETPNDLAVVVFIQDNTDKTVHQSAVMDVSGTFSSYNVTYTVNDEMNAPIEGAEIFMESNGSKVTDAMGQAVFTGVYPGTYAYDVEAPGFFPTSGSVTVIDQNVSETVVMQAPQYYWFEMFDSEIPDDFTSYATNPDFMYWYDGHVIFFRQSSTSNPIMLVTPLIDITPADKIYFDAGQQNGDPQLEFGTITDPNNPETFTVIETYSLGAEMMTYEYDLAGLPDGEVYFAWKLPNSTYSFFSFDNIIITAGGTPPPPVGNCEDFDELTVGGYVAEQLGGNWTTWSNAPGTAEDALVSDMYSISPSNSILVEGTTDLVHLITGENITSGVWSYSVNIYVPEGKTGYWNLQKDVVPGAEWGFQVMFEDDMTMIVDGGAAAAAVIPYQYNTWYNNQVIVDLDNDWCQFYVDGNLELEYQWTLGTFGTPGALTLAGANIFANPGATGVPPGAFFDDICFTEVGNADCDDFDDLTVGGFVADQLGEMWTTWSGAPGGTEDAPVSSDFSNSPDNSFVVNATTIDLIRMLSDTPIETGQWLYSNYIYVPSGKSGYFNVQSDPVPGQEWVIELYFDEGGTGSFAGGSTETFSYAPDTWIFVEVNFDLNSDLAQVFFDGELMVEFANEFTIGGVDYYGSDTGGAPGAYFDDVCFGPGMVITGIDETAPVTTRIYPNPATDVVYITSGQTITSVQIFNYAGRLVANEATNSESCRINTRQYAPGLYIFRIQTAEGFTTQRVVIQ